MPDDIFYAMINYNNNNIINKFIDYLLDKYVDKKNICRFIVMVITNSISIFPTIIFHFPIPTVPRHL